MRLMLLYSSIERAMRRRLDAWSRASSNSEAAVHLLERAAKVRT